MLCIQFTTYMKNVIVFFLDFPLVASHMKNVVLVILYTPYYPKPKKVTVYVMF